MNKLMRDVRAIAGAGEGRGQGRVFTIPISILRRLLIGFWSCLDAGQAIDGVASSSVRASGEASWSTSEPVGMLVSMISIHSGGSVLGWLSRQMFVATIVSTMFDGAGYAGQDGGAEALIADSDR
jgi:hypothetical protein